MAALRPRASARGDFEQQRTDLGCRRQLRLGNQPSERNQRLGLSQYWRRALQTLRAKIAAACSLHA